MTAARALKQAFAINPEDGGNAAVLGQYLTDAGRAQRGRGAAPALRQAAGSALDVLLPALGVALARSGAWRRRRVLERQAAGRPSSNAMTRVELGTVRLLAGQDGGRARAFEDALKLDPGLAMAHHSIGLLAARGGEERGPAHWRAALDRDPGHVDALLPDGVGPGPRGRPDEARRYLEEFVARAPRRLRPTVSWPASGPGCSSKPPTEVDPSRAPMWSSLDKSVESSQYS